jgi:hypothetical protein
VNRKSFWIPVGFAPTVASLPSEYEFRLNSNTLVLPVKFDVQAPFDIERVPGSWSPHLPEKKPKYRVSWETSYGHEFTIEPVRLQACSTSGILVPIIALRSQTCLDWNGKRHGVYYFRGGTAYTYCGESPYIPLRDSALSGPKWVKNEEPTCATCLTHKAVWCRFDVFPYMHKRDETKKARKERTVEEKRLRLPTAYARILDDDLFENPSYKRPKERAEILPEVDEHDPFYDDSERDRKRASAMESVRRVEESKARIQGHRR